MFVVMYCVAIYFTEYAFSLMQNNGIHDSVDFEGIQRYWGTVGSSLTTLYMSISGGDDWRNFVDVFDGLGTMQVVNVWVLSAYVAFGTLVLLNLVTGVFVDGAQRIVRTEKQNELRRKAHALFLHADVDCSEDISWSEFRERLGDEFMLKEYFATVGFNVDEAQHLFQILDEDKNRTINLTEFVNGTLRLPSPATASDTSKILWEVKDNSRQVNDHLLSIEERLSVMNEYRRAAYARD